MKKAIFFLIGLVMMTGGRTWAQTDEGGNIFVLGPVAGFGHSWVGNSGGSTSALPAVYTGLGFIDISKEHWGWGSHVALSSEGYKINSTGQQQTDVPMYLRLPLRAYYFFGNRSYPVRPDVYLGPSFGMKVAEHLKTEGSYGEIYRNQKARNFRLFDTGIDGGAGINVQVGKSVYLNADIGYYQGVTDALKDNEDLYNADRDFDVSLSLLFDLN